MKKIILIAATLGIFFTSSAQKYMTRSAQVSFFSSTALENIEAINNEVAAVYDAGTGDIVIIVPIKSFKFDRALMQEHFNENYLESDQFPKADFKGKIENAAAINYSKDGSTPVKAVGTMTMHGVSQAITVPGTLTVKNGSLTFKAVFKVKNKDYKIVIPSVAANKVAEVVEITVNSLLAPLKK
ncbi:MAG: YceI family protein [Bacteroidota bacterium]